MAENNQNDSDIKVLTDQIKNALESLGDEHQTQEEAEKILSILVGDEDFEQAIEQILACLNEETLDLTKLQTQIVALIKKYLANSRHKGLSLVIDQKLVARNIEEVGNFLVQQRNKLIKSAGKNFANVKDKYQSISDLSRANLKRLIKGFVIYQVYKFTNPKRLAGETKEENFAYNFIKGGMKLALKYEGGSEKDIKKYSLTLIKKLEIANKKFKKGNESLTR